MATEEKSREERRKEGRKDAGVSAFWQTNASIPGGSSTESVSVSLFLFRSSPTLPPRTSRVAAALPLSLSPPRAALSSSLSTGRHQNPPLHSSHHREPRPTTFSLALIHPSWPLSPVPPRAALLAVTTRSPPPDKDKLRCIFRAPKSSNVLHLLFPVPPYATSVLDPRLPPSTELTSYVAQPSSRHFPRPRRDHPRPTPPASETPLCRASNGCSTPTHFGKASCPRTTSRLLQPPANFRALSFLRLLLLPASHRRRTCMLVMGDNSG